MHAKADPGGVGRLGHRGVGDHVCAPEARATVRTIYAEAAAADDAKERERLARWAVASESRSTLRVLNSQGSESSSAGVTGIPGSDEARAKTLPSGGDSYEAARERDHDDIVLAVALACWARHVFTEPRLIDGRDHNGMGGVES